MKRVFSTGIVCILFFINGSADDYFDFRNLMIGISGDYKEFSEGRVSNRVFVNDVPIECTKHLDKDMGFDPEMMLYELNQMCIGKKIVDFLFMYNGSRLSEDLLNQRALVNANPIDKERAEFGVIDSDTIIKEDYYSVLNSNYIFLATDNKSKTNSLFRTWILFKVDISKELVEQIYQCWNSPKEYEKINVDVKFIARGETEMFSTSQNNGFFYFNDIAKTDKNFMLRCPVYKDQKSHKAITNLGEQYEICVGHRFEVYRQFMNKNGEISSRRINTSRAVNITEDYCTLYPIAGKTPSEKKGDIAVYHLDNMAAHWLNYYYQNGSHSLCYEFDVMDFLNNGCSHHWISNVRFGIFNGNGNSTYEIEGGKYRSPYIFDIGVGYGFAYHFANIFELMATVSLNYEGLQFITKTVAPSYSNFIASSLKTPLGIRFIFNLIYPVQLYIGAEYTPFLIKFQEKCPYEIPGYSDEYGDWHRSEKVNRDHGYSAAEKYFIEPTGYKRTGLSLSTGIKISF